VVAAMLVLSLISGTISRRKGRGHPSPVARSALRAAGAVSIILAVLIVGGMIPGLRELLFVVVIGPWIGIATLLIGQPMFILLAIAAVTAIVIGRARA
jgi:hypothetical protein